MLTGMIGEVKYGKVDTSAAGFLTNVERMNYLDFSQGIFKNPEGLIIKTPAKSDQISYFVGM